MEKGIDKVRDSVAYWSATPKRHERFEKMARQMLGEYEKRIALDCKTRWNSTYTMLSTALLYQDVFERLASRAPCVPSTEDWKFARKLCDRLKMFYDVTELLSGTKYVTTNLFFPKICNIFLAIRRWQRSDNPKVEEMSRKMKEKFNKYWSDVHGLMVVAVVLDPRYKLQLLNALFLKIHGSVSVADESVNKVKELLCNLVLEYQDTVEVVATTDGAQTRPRAPPQVDDEDWMDTFDDYMSKQPAVTSTYVRTELDLYFEEPLLPRTQDLDIVQWMKMLPP
ncbi:Zinc finger BED domain-containing protein DAYSLEEPER [Striga hermonthica]|uniref:Zinc finger BED domain-containing protein DAYSLEEPER n=1 Tax=Striga hermonthica TaxID=68872 RepID=A0A9N7R3R9_STRHE|nr:Zinc finger BED domain-containing protein DAYSLEEPER [Striga hermonthica]